MSIFSRMNFFRELITRNLKTDVKDTDLIIVGERNRKKNGGVQDRAMLLRDALGTGVDNQQLTSSLAVGGMNINLSGDNPSFVFVPLAADSLFLEYTALLTQHGASNAPSESVLNDTLTGGVWSYISPGNYHYTKVGAFSNAQKVEVRIEAIQNLFFSMTNNAYNMVSAARLSDDTILVKTTKVGYFDGTQGLTAPTGAGGSISDFPVDDVLSTTPITIRVWF